MEFSVAEVASLLGGKVEGDATRIVRSLEKIEVAEEGGLAFLSNPKYNSFLYTTRASAVLIKEDFVVQQPVSATLIRVTDPYTAFTQLLEFVENQLQQMLTGREEPCFVHETAQIGANVYIGAFAYIGANAVLEDGVKIYPQAYVGQYCSIGAGTVVYAGAKLYHRTEIGERCIIHSGVVIGCDGFGHAPQPDGTYRKIPQTGTVVVGNDCEIGANTTIDRATMGTTVIASGVKMDNLIQIAHNVEVGKNTVIAAQAGVSGSSKIGDNAQIGGQVGVSGHITLADRVRIGAKAGIMTSIVEEGSAWLGAPAQPFSLFMRSQTIFRHLPELERRVTTLEREAETRKNAGE
jgi:UDP-3-O-[3-hydroxymyristoyl] glucosamine N-acyltransferase